MAEKLEKLLAIAQALELSGEELKAYLTEEQDGDRDRRALRREELKMEEERLKLEQLKLEQQREQADTKLKQEKEKLDVDAKLARQKLEQPIRQRIRHRLSERQAHGHDSASATPHTFQTIWGP